MLTQKYLHEILTYYPHTGEWRWIDNRGGVEKYSIAGSINTHGHREICIDGKFYMSGQLIWLYMTGEFPLKNVEIDHINGIRNDDKWENLRLATYQQQQFNRHRQRNNTSNIIGVFWDKNKKRWKAQIVIMYKNIYLGSFMNKEDAIIARKNAEQKYCGSFIPQLNKKDLF